MPPGNSHLPAHAVAGFSKGLSTVREARKALCGATFGRCDAQYRLKYINKGSQSGKRAYNVSAEAQLPAGTSFCLCSKDKAGQPWDRNFILAAFIADVVIRQGVGHLESSGLRAAAQPAPLPCHSAELLPPQSSWRRSRLHSRTHCRTCSSKHM